MPHLSLFGQAVALPAEDRTAVRVLFARLSAFDWIDRSEMLAVPDTSANQTASQVRPKNRGETASMPSPNPETIEKFRHIMIPQLDSAYNLARFLTRDRTRAEDLVQDAYLRALLAFPKFRGGDAKSWLLTIVRNCCMTWLKATAREHMVFDAEYAIDAAEGSTP